MAQVRLQEVSKIYPDGTSRRPMGSISRSVPASSSVHAGAKSGCGKSTTLRMIAGLEEVTSGNHRGRRSSDIVGTPARERDIAMVFENYALYPHLNVFDNIAMPLVAREGRPSRRSASGSSGSPSTMGITEHLRKRPGEAQRRPAPARRPGARHGAHAQDVPHGRASRPSRGISAGSICAARSAPCTRPPAAPPSISPTTRKRRRR